MTAGSRGLQGLMQTTPRGTVLAERLPCAGPTTKLHAKGVIESS